MTDGGAETDLVIGAAGTQATYNFFTDGNGEIVFNDNPGSCSAGGTITSPSTGGKLYRFRAYMRRSGSTSGSITGSSILSAKV